MLRQRQSSPRVVDLLAELAQHKSRNVRNEAVSALATLPDADGSLDPNYAAAEADLTHFVEGDEWFSRKWAALMHHLSQHPDDVDIENPPVEDFKARFGTEWFITKSYNGADDLGVLDQLLTAKQDWIAPT